VASGHPEPDKYWIYERVMTRCLGPDVFTIINTIQF
jgi:hypothetical protein